MKTHQKSLLSSHAGAQSWLRRASFAGLGSAGQGFAGLGFAGQGFAGLGCAGALDPGMASPAQPHRAGGP